jgi:hypothetical protein
MIYTHPSLSATRCIHEPCLTGRARIYNRKLSRKDPFLGYHLINGAIKGIQSENVIANAKHWVQVCGSLLNAT